MSSSLHSRRGQTLVEALVALSILTTGFIGIVTLLTKSFSLNRSTTNDTQATYLAAEGIEVAKNIIDYDTYFGIAQGPGVLNGWGCSFNLTPGGKAKNFALEYDTVPPAPGGCSTQIPEITNGKDQLYIKNDTDSDPDNDADEPLYTYDSSGATPTDFTRDVSISMSSDTEEIDVQSTVTWKNGVLSNTITLEDHFYNWHP